MSLLPHDVRNSVVVDSDELMENFENLENRLGPGDHFPPDPTTTTGLTFGFLGGRVRKNDGTVLTVAAGTIGLTPSATNRVEIDPETGAISVSTVAFTVTKIPLRVLTTDAIAILTNIDARVSLQAGTATQAAIANADGTLADLTTKFNLLLAALRTRKVIAS